MPFCGQKNEFGVKPMTTKLTGVDGFFWGQDKMAICHFLTPHFYVIICFLKSVVNMAADRYINSVDYV